MNRLVTTDGTAIEVSGRLARPVLEALQSLGVDFCAAAREFGIDQASGPTASERIPMPCDVWGWWNTIEKLTGDVSIGIRLAQILVPGRLELLEQLVSLSPTVGDAVEALAELAPVMQTGLTVTRDAANDGETIVLTQDVGRDENGAPRVPPRHAVEFTLAMLILLLDHYACEPIAALQVSFQHGKPANTLAHDEVFGASCCFGQAASSIVLPREALSVPMRTADHGLFVAVLQFVREWASALDQRARPGCEILQQYRESVGDPDISLASIARRLGTSQRTLQRRLREMGTSHREQLDRARREAAETLLLVPGVRVADVADRVGFSEPSAFVRAFRRWTGLAPLVYRRSKTARPD